MTIITTESEPYTDEWYVDGVSAGLEMRGITPNDQGSIILSVSKEWQWDRRGEPVQSTEYAVSVMNLRHERNHDRTLDRNWFPHAPHIRTRTMADVVVFAAQLDVDVIKINPSKSESSYGGEHFLLRWNIDELNLIKRSGIPVIVSPKAQAFQIQSD